MKTHTIAIVATFVFLVAGGPTSSVASEPVISDDLGNTESAQVNIDAAADTIFNDLPSNIFIVPEIVINKFPIEPLDVTINIPGWSPASVVRIDPWSRTNPTVTKSYSTCGGVRQSPCNIKGPAVELGKPQKGWDCSNHGQQAFYDLNGKCYMCQFGFERTWDPVTSGTACINNNMDWVTDRANVGLFRMAGTEDVVPKLSNKEMRDIYLAATRLQPNRNASLVYDLMTGSGESTLLREAIKYHVLQYAKTSALNPSDPEYDVLKWMAEYIRYYRIYIANEAKKMFNAWQQGQAAWGRFLTVMPMNLAPPFKGIVTTSYLLGNGGATALASVESIMIVGGSALMSFAIAGMNTLNAVKTITDPLTGGIAIVSANPAAQVAAVFAGPASIILAGVLIGIQGIITLVQNKEAENSINQGIANANKPYDVNMLVADIKADSTGEFITTFAAAAAGRSIAELPTTKNYMTSLAQDLCKLTGPLNYNNNNICGKV